MRWRVGESKDKEEYEEDKVRTLKIKEEKE